MLNFKVIGAGAAGNKAAIELINQGFNRCDITFVNSTAKDMPESEEFDDCNKIIFGKNTLGGCGKERTIGKKLFLQDLKTNNVNLDSIADPDTNAVIIVSSTEGGSGSAVTPILAKYFKEVVGVPVILCLFFGFNSDVRGMQNSIEICQELSEDYGVIAISNSKFISGDDFNYTRAESQANKLFAQFVRILSGEDIRSGSQNIDDTDLLKIVTTPGYINIGKVALDKIKNVTQFNNAVSSALDDSCLIDISTKGVKRLGLIFDIGDSHYDAMDFSAGTLIERFGVPYEKFMHIQNTISSDTLTWIATGMKLPIDEIKEIFEGYIEQSNSVNKNKDSFFDEISTLQGNEEDGAFNMLNNKTAPTKNKEDFFSDFGMGEKVTKKSSATKSAKSEY